MMTTYTIGQFSIIFFLGFILFSCADSEGEIQPLQNSWDKAIPHQEIPEGLNSLSSESCGACHKDHYEEWQYSTHSQAWTDLQFQAEIQKESSPFMCINCHIPLQNQQEYIIEGLVDGDIYKPVKVLNPHFDKALREEGINCASCHVRGNVIIGPTGTTKAPHKTIKDTDHLSEQLCISCHNAVAVISSELVCTFETGDEWKASSYFGEKNCISCHMDTITRPIVAGYEPRLSHRHYFPGSGISKHINYEAKILNGLVFYPSEVKISYKIGDSISFDFKLVNELAGHKVPTADPERFILTKFILKNEEGEVLSTLTERIGEKWEWYPEAKKIDENNLLPGEERVYNFFYLIKERSTLTLDVIVTKHRMDEKTAEFNKLGDEYPLYITIYEEKFTLKVR